MTRLENTIWWTVAVAFVLYLGMMVARAHHAPMGWEYDPWCCDTKDCAEVPDESVEEVQGGYKITLMPGQHPNVVTEPMIGFVPHNKAEGADAGPNNRIRKSGDWHKHVCIWQGAIRCIYVPPGGA